MTHIAGMGSASLAKRVSHQSRVGRYIHTIQCFQYVQWCTDSGSPSSYFKVNHRDVANDIEEGISKVDYAAESLELFYKSPEQFHLRQQPLLMM